MRLFAQALPPPTLSGHHNRYPPSCQACLSSEAQIVGAGNARGHRRAGRALGVCGPSQGDGHLFWPTRVGWAPGADSCAVFLAPMQESCEFEFDTVFAPPLELPCIVSGELNFSKADVCDAHDASAVARHVGAFASNPYFYTADQVRALNFGTGLRTCDLHHCDKRAFRQIVKSVPEFVNLQQLRVHGCGLTSVRLAQLLSAVAKLANFSGETPAHATLIAGGNAVDDDGCAQFACAGALRGVRQFALTRCDITDRSLPVIAALVPNAHVVHLSKTRIAGVGVAKLLGALQSCHLIGLDDTHMVGEGAVEVLSAMRARESSAPSAPLEAWMRGVAPNDKWTSLLLFASSAKNSKRFVVKHDLQAPLGSVPRHLVQVVECVHVRLWLPPPLPSPVEVVEERVLCTKSVHQIAKDAITELNLVARGDERMPRDRLVRKRRLAYREALEATFASGSLMNKFYSVGGVQFTTRDPNTNETCSTRDVSDRLLGVPMSHVRYEIDVEAHEAESPA